jgi:hypothetical protein
VVLAVVLSRGFGSARLNRHVTALAPPLMDFASRSEFDADHVSPYWFDEPTTPLDLSSTLWCFAASQLRNRSHYSEDASRRVPRSSRVLPGHS